VRVLVTGANGQLGRDLVTAFGGEVPPGGRRRALFGPEGAGPGVDVVAAAHGDLPVDERASVLETVHALRPDVVVHAAAWTAVDDCEADADRAYRVNALGTRNVAEACEATGAHLVYLSTDYVFDGESERPYVEWDGPRPISVYGASKLAGERECLPRATVVRTSWVCGASGDNVVRTALRLAAGDAPLRFVDDQRGSPTFTADLAAAVVTLALDRRPGVHHVTNQGATTWYGFVRAVLEAAGEDPGRVRPIATSELDPPRPARRPANSVLDNAALRLATLPLLPDWRDGLGRLVAVLRA
jgi:dTDP-4-dehydrorhamnose reductase